MLESSQVCTSHSESLGSSSGYIESLKRKSRDRKYYLQHKEIVLLKRKLRRYNITSFQWEQLLVRSKGKCELCGNGQRRLDVDHNHITGKVRGLLCRPCNRYLGFIEKDRTILEKMREYLDNR